MNIAIAMLGLAALAIVFYLALRRVTVEFGILRTSEEGDELAEATTEIPFRTVESGFAYGLIFQSALRRRFRAKVVHFLPAAPSVIGGDLEASGKHTSDGRYKIEGDEREYTIGGVRRFQFSAGDPLGDYEVQLFVDGSLHTTVSYQVVQDAS